MFQIMQLKMDPKYCRGFNHACMGCVTGLTGAGLTGAGLTGVVRIGNEHVGARSKIKYGLGIGIYTTV
jgi:hypothetical protein